MSNVLPFHMETNFSFTLKQNLEQSNLDNTNTCEGKFETKDIV